jgi:hypothetical protein
MGLWSDNLAQSVLCRGSTEKNWTKVKINEKIWYISNYYNVCDLGIVIIYGAIISGFSWWFWLSGEILEENGQMQIWFWNKFFGIAEKNMIISPIVSDFTRLTWTTNAEQVSDFLIDKTQWFLSARIECWLDSTTSSYVRAYVVIDGVENLVFVSDSQLNKSWGSTKTSSNILFPIQNKNAIFRIKYRWQNSGNWTDIYMGAKIIWCFI